jgi:ABC-type transport system involved in multi-copper enzyme maturation permease subunit
MYRALILKELRELWWMSAIALIVMSGCVLYQMGLGFCMTCGGLYWKQSVDATPPYLHPQPFFNKDLMLRLTLVGTGLAIALGAWQTWGESLCRTWNFLLHRPVRRNTIIWVKLAIGLILLLASTGLPLLVYAIWAAIPGTHANPFAWWMTLLMLRVWFATTLIYLGVFLCGIREARWYVSRFWPVVPMGVILLFRYVSVSSLGQAHWVVLVVSDGLVIGSVLMLLAAIPYAAKNRDFA